MKQLLLILGLLVSTLTKANVQQPLPWDKPLKVWSPISELSVWFDNGGYPYGYVQVIVKRPFAYTTCESTTIEVMMKTRFRKFGTWPPQYEYRWGYMSFPITIPANQDMGYTTYVLQVGEEANVNDYVSPGYLDYCN